MMCSGVADSKTIEGYRTSCKLFNEIGPRYANRPGGYTRIYKLAKVRQGDAAPMAVIDLLGADEQVKSPVRPALATAPA